MAETSERAEDSAESGPGAREANWVRLGGETALRRSQLFLWTARGLELEEPQDQISFHKVILVRTNRYLLGAYCNNANQMNLNSKLDLQIKTQENFHDNHLPGERETVKGIV